MANTCTHCTRINPSDAQYCYYDGRALGGGARGPENVGAREFPAAFVFPSGQVCRTFDQLALACQNRWDEARELLRQGHLGRFFASIGRHDLAQAAGAAVGFPDLDRGLDQLVARFPTQTLQPPRLAVEPAEIDLGTLRADADQRFQIRLRNLGMRLLYGSAVSDSRWLTFGEGAGASQKLFQFNGETLLTVTVRASQLRAGAKGLEARLVIESNGGAAGVTVKAQVPSKAFGEGILAGAQTPRQLAEKARESPKDAARYFESGAVERWYKANGWIYPVQGPSANGVAAVQQFFEALGLAKPPRVELAEPMISIRGRAGETIGHALQLRSPDKRPVFASAASDQPWLRVGATQSAGAGATIPLEVGPISARPGEVMEARLVVTANGGQRFVVPVSLSVTAGAARISEAMKATSVPFDTAVEDPARRKTATRKSAVVTAAAPRRRDEDEGGSRRSPMLLIGLLLLLLLGAGGIAAVLLLGGDGQKNVQVAVADDDDKKDADRKQPDGGKEKPVIKVDVQDDPDEVKEIPVVHKPKIEDEPEERVPGTMPPAKAKVEIKDEPDQPATGKGKSYPIDPTPRVRYQYENNGAKGRFGLVATANNKRLTYAADGGSNSTVLSINNQVIELGDPRGNWSPRPTGTPDDPQKSFVQRTHSVYTVGRVSLTQILEIVPSSQPVMVGGTPKRLLDTLKVHWILENQDNKKNSAGLRIQFDTLIGGNDGVPFTVPGRAGLVQTAMEFPAQGPIPAFLQALENPNLQNPGVIAHMTLKPPAKHELPSKVQLTRWPSFNYTPWAVPAGPFGSDSCVVLYWNEKVLQPKQKREFSFTYGLGRVESTEPQGKLGMTLNGDFEPGQQFLVTAYVQNPVAGQKLKLELPDGLQRAEGADEVPVPAATGKERTSIVTWKVRVLQTGEFTVRIKSSTGASAAKTISIARGEAQAEGKLVLDLQPPFEPGKDFTVIGRVTGPVAGQKLTLGLPARGLERTGGDETQDVPMPVGGKDGTSEVQWRVKVLNEGIFPIRLISSTGLVVTKKLTIEASTITGGRFVVRLGGEVAPGKEFTVDAHVTDPLPNQTLKLRLDKGMERVGGEETLAVPGAPKGGTSKVSWRVKVADAGKYLLKVESSHGIIKPVRLTIEKQETGGKFEIQLAGDIAPGKEFEVAARVTNPVAGQRLTLQAGDKLKLVESEASQPVPHVKDGTVTVRWRVRIVEAGVIPVRVESTTGVTRTKRLTITETAGPGNIFGK